MPRRSSPVPWLGLLLRGRLRDAYRAAIQTGAGILTLVVGVQMAMKSSMEGYTKTFRELMADTAWDQYGTGRNEKCADCMVHCGYEASAVEDTFGTVSGFSRTVKLTLLPTSR